MTTYRLDRAAALQAVGSLVVAAAVAVFLAFVLVSRDGAVATVGWVLAGLAALLVLVAVRLAWRPPVVVRLDEHGLRGRREQVRWTDVERVDESRGLLLLTTAAEHRVAVPLAKIGRRRGELLAEVHERLNTAHGYRRFTP
ncbi:MAG: hypothetical protein PGN07_10180 [Aeromicrobium erythreum]